jgi:hypothetical protein
MVNWRNLSLIATLIWIALLFGRVVAYKLTEVQCPCLSGFAAKFAAQGLLLYPFVVWGCQRTLQAWEDGARRRAVYAAVVTAAVTGLLAAAVGDWIAILLGSEAALLSPPWALDALEFALLSGCCLGVVSGIHTARGHRAERRLRRRQEEIAGLERLRALRCQLNPHFLFNSLGGVADLVETDPVLAQRLVTVLGSLLHRTLRASEHEEHPLSEELAYVEAYLHIERIRRASSVSWQLHAEPATLMKRVPTLILLPLVENAITHGAPAGEGLPIHVTIEARERFEDLVLRVTNSCGPRAATDRAACTGTGLRNTRERLRLLFGGAAAFAQDCSRPGRFAVEIRLPAALHRERRIAEETLCAL